MPLKPSDVELAYKLILERAPSAQEIANVGNQHSTLQSLRQILLNSEEFYRKFKRIRTTFEERQTPILVHMHVPHATAPGVVKTLGRADDLRPSHHMDMAGFAQFCAQPRPERLKARYLHGDLAVHAGASLDLPWRRLCSIRKPGPRIYALYREACAAENVTDMSFGAYLEHSLASAEHRIELESGQVRRLAGRTGPDSFGHESTMLREALHVALGSDTILGLYEHPGLLISTLADHGFIDPNDRIDDVSTRDASDNTYDGALKSLTGDQRQIFDSYTAWDDYLYAVCAAMLFSPSE
ncbi:MAG: hypothetical protein AAFS01_00030 [Pseudomonadota bacterium]